MDVRENAEPKNTPHVIKGLDNVKARFGERVVTCVTGVRPSGRLHLGHYVGALKNWLLLQGQENIKCNFLIADYQVLGDHLGEVERMRQSVVDVAIDWLAIGLDPAKTNFVVQSYVPEFAELFNYLTMFVPYSVATNNPTLRDEMKKIETRAGSDEASVSLGFVNYPVSQVADIMLLGGEIVPTGEDQIPHIELARKVIKKVNSLCKTKFPLPVVLLSETPKLVGVDGSDKMSKSLGNTIFLSSSANDLKKQVNKMYTDPGKVSKQAPGNIDKHVVFKYLDIFFEDKEQLADLKRRYVEGGENSVADGELKKLLVDALEKIIAPIRERRAYYEQHRAVVAQHLEDGSQRAREEGAKTLTALKDAIGVSRYGRTA